jgi:predicted nucleic acid-binding protein
MIVVSDTSAISNLLAIGLEGILHDLFGEVLIPPAVELELMRWHSELPTFLSVVVPVTPILNLQGQGPDSIAARANGLGLTTRLNQGLKA